MRCSNGNDLIKSINMQWKNDRVSCCRKRLYKHMMETSFVNIYTNKFSDSRVSLVELILIETISKGRRTFKPMMHSLNSKAQCCCIVQFYAVNDTVSERILSNLKLCVLIPSTSLRMN